MMMMMMMMMMMIAQVKRFINKFWYLCISKFFSDTVNL